MTEKQVKRANVRMSLAQLRREGRISTRPHRDPAVSQEAWFALEFANEAERAVAERTRQKWVAEGRPEYGEHDLFLFIDEVASG